MGIVTLITDFGGFYPAIMKAAILNIAPDAAIIDVTHDISPHGVREAAFILRETVRYFPRGTVHIAVVDPTVGTERHGLVVVAGGQYLIGPDNGLLIPAARRLGNFEVLRIQMAAKSRTFHGRDIFAPVGAHILTGRLPHAEHSPTFVDLRLEEAQQRGDALFATIVFVDRFGNCVTNIPSRLMIARSDYGSVHLLNGSTRLRLVRTYDEAVEGQPLLTIGSFDLIEIALNKGDAAKELNLSVGDEIVLVTP
jgi:S-adenosylmethionine hydrolase